MDNKDTEILKKEILAKAKDRIEGIENVNYKFTVDSGKKLNWIWIRENNLGRWTKLEEPHFEIHFDKDNIVGIDICFSKLSAVKPYRMFLNDIKIRQVKYGLWYRYKNGSIINDENIINYLVEGVLYFQENYGPKIKSILANLPIPIVNNDSIDSTKETTKAITMNYPLNQILYGAPGTGKTYSTKKLAVEIIDGAQYSDSTEDREKLNIRYEALKNSNQIHFTTFHQSMSYEDFIEGIKPITVNNQVIYEVVDGIFKRICKDSYSKSRLNENITKTETSNFEFENLYSMFLENISNLLEELDEQNELKVYSKRSYVKILKVEEDRIITIGDSAKTEEPIERSKIKRIYDKFSDVNQITNIVKQLREIGTDIGWTTNYYAIFKYFKEFEEKIKISNSSTKSFNKLNEKYVLIIDEINRGNISAIFGELITLIEEDKRKGILSNKSETIEVTLPYSKDKFSVPDNLYIIGTMNTADRSVEALDTALRRRFSFTEMQPEPDLLKDSNFSDVDLKLLLETINLRIEMLLDKNHKIGHAYFIGIESIDDLRSTFKNKIMPLLEEYFYGDFGKIGLVLGENFIEIRNNSKKEVLADFKAYDDLDFIADKKVYQLTKDISEMEVSDFESIYL